MAAVTEYSTNLGGVLGFVRDLGGQALDFVTARERAQAETSAYLSAIGHQDARTNANAQAQANRTVQISRPIVIGAVAVAVLVLMLRN